MGPNNECVGKPIAYVSYLVQLVNHAVRGDVSGGVIRLPDRLIPASAGASRESEQRLI
jgi:hypothetical protein